MILAQRARPKPGVGGSASSRRGFSNTRTMSFGNAGPGIGDDELEPVGTRGVGLDKHKAAARRELDRVRDKMVDHALNEALVGLERGRRAVGEAPSRGAPLLIGHRLKEARRPA